MGRVGRRATLAREAFIRFLPRFHLWYTHAASGSKRRGSRNVEREPEKVLTKVDRVTPSLDPFSGFFFFPARAAARAYFFRYSASHSCTVFHHSSAFCGFATKWVSSGK